MDQFYKNNTRPVLDQFNKQKKERKKKERKWSGLNKIIKAKLVFNQFYEKVWWLRGWMGGWMSVKAVLRIAYSNQKTKSQFLCLFFGITKLNQNECQFHNSLPFTKSVN